VSSLHFNSKPLVVDCLHCIIRLQVKLSNTYSIRARYAAAKRPSLSWLSVSFFLHVKYTVSYRIVSYRRLTTGIRPAVSRGYGYTRGSGTGRVGFLATGRVPVRVKFLVTGMGRVENLCTRSPLLLIPSGLPLWISGLF